MAMKIKRASKCIESLLFRRLDYNQQYPILSSSPMKCFFVTSTTNTTKSTNHHSVAPHTKRPPADPTAKRPNEVCDPYGQAGKPLSWDEARKLMITTGLHDGENDESGWSLVDRNGEIESMALERDQSHDHDHHHCNSGNYQTSPSAFNDHDNNDHLSLTNKKAIASAPWALTRCFQHVDYMQAAKFLSILCAVAHNHNHYPNIQLKRQLYAKQWRIITTVTCHTTLLQGLSYNDFHIAMVRT